MPRRPEFLVLAMDIGSSSTRSALFDQKGRVLSETRARSEYAVRYTQDGGAELPAALIQRASRNCLAKDIGSAARFPHPPGYSDHRARRLCFLAQLARTGSKGRPLTPIFTWADSRCTPDAVCLREEFNERQIHRQTGCMLRASFWPAKLRWLRRTEPRLFRRVARWVSPVEWIFEELFGAAGCSRSMASATGLYDLGAQRWHPGLREACGVEVHQLGKLAEMADARPSAFREIAGARICFAIGDGAASNLGCGADGGRRIAINVGTSAAVRMMRMGEWSTTPFGLFRYAVDGERSLLGGAVSNAGNLHRWCLRELRLGQSALEKALSRSAAASDAATVLPFWVAERAPNWPENLAGVMAGLSQTTDAAQIHRATQCAVYYRLGQILALIERAAGPAREIIVSGGILSSPAALRLLADSLGRDLSISSERESSLRGAAVYALEKAGGKAAPLRTARKLRHDRALARKHRLRHERQAALEQLLLGNGN